jgi:hypothetical protein
VAVALDEPARFGQVPQELTDEQRVALGLDVHRLGQLEDRRVEGVPGRDLDELLHVRLAQPVHLESLHVAFATEVGQHAGEGMGAVEVGVAERPDGEQAGRRRPGHVPEQEQRRLGRPLQVVEHQQDRHGERHAGEDGRDRLEHAVAPRLGLVAVVLAGQRQAFGDGGEQPGQVGSVGADEVAQLVGGAGRDQRPEGVDERLVRHAELLVAAPVQDGGTVGVHPPRQLGHEAGLAHTRLTRHQHEPARTGDGPAPALVQHRHLGGAADEHEPLRGVERVGEGRAEAAPDVPAHAAGRHRLQKAFQLHQPDRLEIRPRPGPDDGGHEVVDQDLAGLGGGAQPGRFDDGRAEPVAVLHGRLADRDAGPQGQRHARVAPAEPGDRALHGGRGGDGLGGGGEADHEAVAQVLDLDAAVRLDRVAQRTHVVAPHVVAAFVGQPRQQRGGVDEVAEQQRDGPGRHRRGCESTTFVRSTAREGGGSNNRSEVLRRRGAGRGGARSRTRGGPPPTAWRTRCADRCRRSRCSSGSGRAGARAPPTSRRATPR